MTKRIKSSKPQSHAAQAGARTPARTSLRDPAYLWSMSNAPASSESTHWFQILIASFFTAFIMMVVRLAPYKADMSQFFWSQDKEQFVDMFSLVKSHMILAVAIFCVVVALYHAMFQMVSIKRSYAYIPILLYSAMVLLSYFFSEYKEFALWGWRERFEGTVILIAYMVVLIYTINAVNSERNVKWILYPVAATSCLLGLIGASQYFGHDFFKTAVGGRLIVPRSYWDNLDTLRFNFEEGQIYQTVFNPNYVSFYLTLLVPLFALIFIYEKRPAIKAVWAAVYTLLLFNLAGSASSGGFLGLGIAFIAAVALLNRRLIKWRYPVLILLAVTVAIGSFTFARTFPEVSGAIKGVLNITETQPDSTEAQAESADPTQSHLKIDYFETALHHLDVVINGQLLRITPSVKGNSMSLKMRDGAGGEILAKQGEESNILEIKDKRFDRCRVALQIDQDTAYLLFMTDDTVWPFAITDDGLRYRNSIGKLVKLEKTPAFGFASNQKFGTYRGYIWSRSLPLVKDTILIGHGADTFCAYFPHNDYAGKYSIGWNRNMIVDKPHNFYLATAINTGVVSLIALLALFGLYFADSFRLYWKLEYQSFLHFAGAGILIGVCGFLAAAMVNDSSVSVMPLFYGLLGTGIAINRIIRRENSRSEKAA